MTKQYNQTKKVKKEVKEIKEEIDKNDQVHKRNKENFKVQVQVSLIQHAGYNPNNPMYDTFLERMEVDMTNTNFQLDSKMKVINPQYEYQTNPKWVELQMKILNKTKTALDKAITELKLQITTAEDTIKEQITRWEERRSALISRLKELGEETKELEKPTYIG